MGIRYYAYAFDEHMTEQALADPHSILSDDPLADAWGLEPGAMVSVTTFEQSVAERDMLYLDKAWRHLQALTAPAIANESARPAFRMFEGQVAMHALGWHPWVRVLPPAEIPEIARDLQRIDDAMVSEALVHAEFPGVEPREEAAYAADYLHRARIFVSGLAEEHRGMVYMIG